TSIQEAQLPSVQVRRPLKVCLCPFLPAKPLTVSSHIYILQHPAEENRVLRTVPLLTACLPRDHCSVLVGRHFPEDKYPELARVCRSPSTLLLFPGRHARKLSVGVCPDPNLAPFSLLLLDGTWRQAHNLYEGNPLLQIPQQVRLQAEECSSYVIRTQPSQTCLSTLESAACALALLEGQPHLREVLLQPLHALCSFQLQHGAQVHDSKEQLLNSGRYNKPWPRNKRKLRRLLELRY
uniref:tRNA-uridine aminocarboxypropyltransferase n=1 Tax=Eptatretus burgeri TaxID=7764 RepID=A0A8C4QFL1_EPTBU